MRYQPAGLDVLDADGAGAGLLAAAVGDCDGGASVGDGFGAADVPCGCEFEVPALGAADAE